MMTGKRLSLLLSISLMGFAGTGCSIRGYAINQIGKTLSSGGASTFERDDDIQLVGDALPFTLKLTELLLDSAPRNRGLLQSATQQFTAYSYGYVHWEADKIREADLGESRRQRARAQRLYMRGHEYGLRGLEAAREGFRVRFDAEPEAAVLMLRDEDVPQIYWTAAALGLAIAADPNDPAMLVRLPEVEALLDRALELDEAWGDGALHEFQVVFQSARPGAVDQDRLEGHFRRAEELSMGKHAGLYTAYAEAVAVPSQDAALFRSMLTRALEIDPDEHEDVRLTNLIAQERARWLLERTDDLILDIAISD